ncbi:MAG TPA: carbohydrate-binding protein [Tissierellaceae bacterium]|nr:carbohydrate-binding protein [Tissierellaceae bacterium]
MIQVIDGEITKYSLPKIGTLKDGSTISGYHLLDEETLALEGWLPLEDIQPEYDIETQYLVPSGYEILEDKVIKQYQIKELSELPISRDEQIDAIILAVQKLIRVDELEPGELTEMIDLYPNYTIDTNYNVGDIFKYEGKLYKVIQAHTSLEGWKPDELPALYLNLLPDNVIPEWVQPAGSHDAYNKGDKVIFEGEVYESIIDGNTWSPTDYPQGWGEG